jgi:predicted permease
VPVEAREWWGKNKEFVILGGPASISTERRYQVSQASIQSVTPEYFDTFGIEMIRGRKFTDQDTATGVPVTIVNEQFVKRFLPNVDPLGKWIITRKFAPLSRTGRPPVQLQIVGVFRNVKNSGLWEESAPEFDVPFWQNPWPQPRMAVRTFGDPLALTKQIAGTLTSVQEDLPLANLKTMDEVVDDVLARDRFSTMLYASFGFLALLLAAVGIYGVMAFIVAQRTHEIGLRMALGAGRQAVIALVLREGLTLAGVGLLLGLAGAYLAARVLRSLMYGMRSMDLGVLAVVVCTLLAAATLATYLPARRAASVDPVSAMRYE